MRLNSGTVPKSQAPKRIRRSISPNGERRFRRPLGETTSSDNDPGNNSTEVSQRAIKYVRDFNIASGEVASFLFPIIAFGGRLYRYIDVLENYSEIPPRQYLRDYISARTEPEGHFVFWATRSAVDEEHIKIHTKDAGEYLSYMWNAAWLVSYIREEPLALIIILIILAKVARAV